MVTSLHDCSYKISRADVLNSFAHCYKFIQEEIRNHNRLVFQVLDYK